ncbi:MAG TPA: branched-chain amino acid transporter AzlD [Lachnospiraceae bacterium]|nr:branched-chain amino acid transporter AzlD [Lachnospiraceae bacterium]
MNFDVYAAVLVLLMALVTWLLRFMPFFIFGKSTPPYIVYLGKVLPSAIIGMLVIYCLKDVDMTAAPFGLPECMAVGSVVVLQYWKRNSLISILFGTVLYMALIRLW